MPYCFILFHILPYYFIWNFHIFVSIIFPVARVDSGHFFLSCLRSAVGFSTILQRWPSEEPSGDGDIGGDTTSGEIVGNQRQKRRGYAKIESIWWFVAPPFLKMVLFKVSSLQSFSGKVSGIFLPLSLRKCWLHEWDRWVPSISSPALSGIVIIWCLGCPVSSSQCGKPRTAPL